MKRKYTIYQDAGFERETGPVREAVKTFKNERDALSFYNDPKNVRRFGTLYLNMQDEAGVTYDWDDRKEMWQQYE